MKITLVDVQAPAIASLIRRSTTGGLSSAYQRTGYATQCPSAVLTTGGELVIEYVLCPELPPAEEGAPLLRPESLATPDSEAAAGYQAMADLSEHLAEEALPAVAESWPSW